MRFTQRTFTAGEISPAVGARADFEKYTEALSTCKNAYVRAQGGVYNREGLKFVGEVDDSTKKHRLIPFSFNVEQTYILVFGDYTMQVIMDGGFVLSGGSRYVLTTPFAEADLPNIKFTQTADVMTITCKGYPPMELKRLAHDNWTLTDISFASTTPAPTGLSAVAVGDGGGSYTKTYRYVVTAFDSDDIESLASAEVSLTTNSLSQTYGAQISWTAVTGATKYRVYKDPSNGSGVYGYIGETTTTQFEDYNFAPDTSTAPPEDSLPFASDYPAACGLYQQRRIFANTPLHPQRVFCTQTGNLYSMRSSTPTRDTDAIIQDVVSREVNEIRHIIDQDMLILLTAGGEMRVTEGLDFVLTPATFGVRTTSRFGCSDVAPVIAGDTVIFVQEQGSRLVGLTSSGVDMNGVPTLVGNDLTILGEHLLNGRSIVEMAYAKEPNGILWMVMSDGDLVGLTYHREHKVYGLHQHSTPNGAFESVATVTEGDISATYFIVRRTINGATVRYVERMEERHDNVSEDAFFVDSGLSYNGPPTTTLSGLDHLEGETVVALADGNVVENLTVSSGSVTLPYAASKVHVGLSYTTEITTLALDTSKETLLGRVKSVNQVFVRRYKSRGLKAGPAGGTLRELKARTTSDGYGPIELRTDEVRISLDRGWNSDGKVTIQQTYPLPMAILAITPEFDIE